MAQLTGQLDKNLRHNNVSKIRSAGRPVAGSLPRPTLCAQIETIFAELNRNNRFSFLV